MTRLMTCSTPLASLLFSTARIEATHEAGTSTGTAFVFSYRGTTDDPRMGIPFLVTNRHVVEGSHTARFTFLKAADEELEAAYLGEPFSFTLADLPHHCFFHPDSSIDLCAFFLGPYLEQAWTERQVRPFFRAIGSEQVPTSDNPGIDAVETVHMVGYPNGIMDDVHLLPVIRRGITATPFGVPYRNKPEFLVDISVFPGSSGSPLMLVDPPSSPTPRILFLGVLSSGYFRTQQHSVERAPVPTGLDLVSTTSEMLDLGLAIRSHSVLELTEEWLARHVEDMPTRGEGSEQPESESSDGPQKTV